MGIGVFVGLPMLSREYLYCFTGIGDYVGKNGAQTRVRSVRVSKKVFR